MQIDEMMFYRNRTEEFVILRRAAKKQMQWVAPGADPTPAPSSSTNLSLEDEKQEMKRQLCPAWVSALEGCKTLENTIRTKLERLHNNQQEYFTPRFGLSDAAEQQLLKDIEHQTVDVKKLVREFERMVKVGVKVVNASNPDEVRAASNVQKHLMSRLNSLLCTFRDGESLFAELLRKRDERTKKFRHIGSAEVHERLEREEKIAGYMEMGYSQVEITELIAMDAQAQETASQVNEILALVTELHEMFTDIHGLVVEQGTVLDRIDYNVTSASQNIGKGMGQLKAARVQQDKCAVS